MTQNKALKHKLTWLAYCGLAILVIIDQISKVIIDRNLSDTDSIAVIPGFFFLDKTYNRGAAFSFMAGQTWGIYLLAAISVLAGMVFIYFIHRAQSKFGKYLFMMLAAGTIGNGIDRISKGYVLDFFDAHFGAYIFPTFNVADCYLTVHVLLIVLLVILKKYDPEQDLDLYLDKAEVKDLHHDE